jgi:hypothetical protein
VGGLVLKSRPVVSMKKGAALSPVLAPAGTAMFWVTQAGWATTGGTTVDINAAVRTAPSDRQMYSSFFVFSLA